MNYPRAGGRALGNHRAAFASNLCFVKGLIWRCRVSCPACCAVPLCNYSHSLGAGAEAILFTQSKQRSVQSTNQLPTAKSRYVFVSKGDKHSLPPPPLSLPHLMTLCHVWDLTALLLVCFERCFHTIVTEAMGNTYSNKECSNIGIYFFFQVARFRRLGLILWISVFL